MAERHTLLYNDGMHIPNIFPMLTIGLCLVICVAVSCGTVGGDDLRGKSQINSPAVYPLTAPAAGNYPQSLYKYPFRAQSLSREFFTQTLEWEPRIQKTFDTDTQYTATLTLEPADRQHTFSGIDITDVKGLPCDSVENINAEITGDTLVIRIIFAKTAAENAEPQIIFSDDFNGTALDKTKWELCPEWDRQGRSSWRDDMASVGGGMLRLKMVRDQKLGAAKSSKKVLVDNWIRAGAIRTRTREGNWPILFDNTFGYYEARIKFPVVSGTWGAFWLMSPTQDIITADGVIGTEIDIVESIHNQDGRYNAALHWNGYGSYHKSAGSNNSGNTVRPDVDIYDGEFHIFALDWSPSEYVFYVDGQVFWRVDGGSMFGNCGINQNPNFIKLSAEGAEWAGELPPGFIEDEMLVDYVRVYNQPQIVK